MKKVFLFALAAIVVASGFTSCKQDKKDDPGTNVKIVLSEHELMMAKDENQRLRVIEPASGYKFTWKSTNEAVATVNATGNVTAIANGEAQIIVSAEGATSDTCRVIVAELAILDTYDVKDYGVFGAEPSKWIEGSDTLMSLSWLDGGPYNCKIGLWTVIAWDGNLEYVYGSGFAGAGFMTFGYVPFYTLADDKAGDDNGTPFGWGSFIFADTQGKIYRNVGEAGKVDKDKYCEYMESYYNEIQKETPDRSNVKFDLFAEAVTGAQIWVADYTETEPVWYVDYGLVQGLVDYMQVVYDGNTQTFKYTADVKWFDFLSDDTYYGLVLQKEGEDYVVAHPYDLRMIARHYGEETNEVSATNNETFVLKRYMEMPKLPSAKSVIRVDQMYRK